MKKSKVMPVRLAIPKLIPGGEMRRNKRRETQAAMAEAGQNNSEPKTDVNKEGFQNKCP
jgi:hypothetical protein